MLLTDASLCCAPDCELLSPLSQLGFLRKLRERPLHDACARAPLAQDGWGPLHAAAFNGRLAIAQLLVRTGGKMIIGVKTQSGNTALDLARNYAKGDVAKFLDGMLNQPEWGQKDGPRAMPLSERPPWDEGPYTRWRR